MRDTGFQAAMGQIAIGSGGLFGRGLGNGMQKQLYLPEPHNDFIFATWCEEMGLIGALAVIAVFAYLIWRGLRIARSCARPHGHACWRPALPTKLAIQTHDEPVRCQRAVMPVTGASLPFFSYGGTALMLQLDGNGHPAQCLAVYAHRGANRIAKAVTDRCGGGRDIRSAARRAVKGRQKRAVCRSKHSAHSVLYSE